MHISPRRFEIWFNSFMSIIGAERLTHAASAHNYIIIFVADEANLFIFSRLLGVFFALDAAKTNDLRHCIFIFP